MRSESLKKLSSLAVNGTALLAVSSLLSIGVLVLITMQDAGTVNTVVSAVTTAGLIGLFIMRFLSHPAAMVVGDELHVPRPLSLLRIKCDAIHRLQRIKRQGGSASEKVRITYRHHGRDREIDLKPENPSLLIADLRDRCPDLSATRTSKSKRSGNFRRATETAFDPPEGWVRSREPDW